jgi:hypothetical protein
MKGDSYDPEGRLARWEFRDGEDFERAGKIQHLDLVKEQNSNAATLRAGLPLRGRCSVRNLIGQRRCSLR